MAKGKRILVTGGAGFIGSHLADAILQQGHEVAVMGLSTGGQEQVPSGVQFYPYDIKQNWSFSRLLFSHLSTFWEQS